MSHKEVASNEATIRRDRSHAAARALLADDPDEMDEHWLAEIIAAARREGAEEMRERAAQWHDEQANELHEERARYCGAGRFNLQGYDRRIEFHRDAAKALRALPLTPEESTSKYRWCNRSDCCLCEMEERLPDECRHYVPEEPA